MTELLLMIARWTIPPCIALAVLLKLASPMIADFKAMLPPSFSLRHPPAPPLIDREIQRLLEGADGYGKSVFCRGTPI